ncbi:MAG: SWIM zinc finger family protein [Thiofilum sp.]|uniref:SWIM zinc finger family protein n=1 Tax=Thiofilum sp. TaxID=2212733 RepID=UPI0026007C66|nr:SWIM zinc finger family protein [Thiofilum sp.]MBK8454609.1 SWIM zinc finger family protein [Thiofilum sp.]
MNLTTFEAQISSVIVQRGRDYVSHVRNLEETEPDFWQAEVKGSYLYDVEIEIKHNTITHWSCSCPYDGYVCKHVVATLFNIRNTFSRDPNNSTLFTPKFTQVQPKRLTQQERVAQVLEQLPQEQLNRYLIELFKEHRDLQEQFLLRFEEHQDAHKVKKDFLASFQRLVDNHTDHDYMDYADTRNFAREAALLLNTLQQSKIAEIVKVDIYLHTIEAIEEVAQCSDDSNGELNGLLNDIAQALDSLSDALTEEQITELHQQLYALNKNLDYGLDSNFEELLHDLAVNRPHLQDYMIEKLQQSLMTASPTYQQQSIALKLERHLIDWGREEEAKQLTSKLITIPEFRERHLKQLLEQKNYDEAITLLTEGIQLATKEKQNHIIAKWRKYLITIAHETNNTELLRIELLNSFQESGYKLKDYLELRSTYEVEQWKTIKNTIYDSIPKHHTLQRADILQAENNISALYELVTKSNSLNLLKNHALLLSATYPNEIKQKYTHFITENLKYTGREVYEQAAKDLKMISLFPEGSALAKQLIETFNVQYKNRPLMVKLFNDLKRSL